MVFYVVGDSSSVGMKRRKKGCKRDKDEKKRMNAAALVTQCRSIGRKTETGSSFNAAALKTQCRSIGKKTEIREIGRIANAAALRSECHDISP